MHVLNSGHDKLSKIKEWSKNNTNRSNNNLLTSKRVPAEAEIVSHKYYKYLTKKKEFNLFSSGKYRNYFQIVYECGKTYHK